MEADKGMQRACYDCVYRGTLAGDCHSRCLHPQAQCSPESMEIEGDPHGIKNGWFRWPRNFDPVWLRHCNGFKQKGVANDKA